MQYERRRYTKAIGEDDPAQVLPQTKSWLQTGFRKVPISLTYLTELCIWWILYP